MRLHAVFLLVVLLGVASSNGFFIKKAAVSLAGVKTNLVHDAKTAVSDLKQSAALKVKAVTGGIKAIGKAKLGLAKGVKSAKVGVLKGIAGAKLAKVAAIKAGKIVFAKTLVGAKLAPIGLHSVKTAAKAAGPLGSKIAQGLKDQIGAASAVSQFSIGGLFSRLGGIASSLSGGVLSGAASSSSSANSAINSLGGSGLALFPAPSAVPTNINIVTYKGEAPKPLSQSSGYYAPSAPVTSYGTPILPPSTSYGVPFRR